MRITFSPRATTLALALVTTGTLALAEEDASDWQYGNFQNTDLWSFTPNQLPISKRDVDALSKALELDDAQLGVIEDLLATTASRHRLSWVRFAEQRADSQHAMSLQNDYGRGQAKLTELASEYKVSQRQALEELFDDVRLILTPEQDARWPKVERDRRRLTTLSEYASFNDEAMDLVSIADALAISDETRHELDPILDRYSQTIDPLLAARNRKAETLGVKLRDLQAMQFKAYSPNPDGMDMDAMASAQQEFAELQIAVVPEALALRAASARIRDVNREFKREIQRSLPESAIEDWNSSTTIDLARNRNPWMGHSRCEQVFTVLENLEQMKSTFEMQASMYEEGQFNEYLMIVRAVEPLTPTQLDEVESLRERFEAEMERVEAQHKAAPSDPEKPNSIQIVTPDGTLSLTRISAQEEAMAAGFWPQNQAQDLEHRKARAEVEQGTIERLREILTVNQRAMIAYN